MGDAAFREAFGTGEQCRNASTLLHRRDGFIRPGCGHRGHCLPARRPSYRCNRCGKRTSLTAGTILHSTKRQPTVRFAATHPVVTAGNSIPSVEPDRRLGVGKATARTMKRRIMAVMARREGEKPPSERVGMGDAHSGSVRSSSPHGVLQMGQHLARKHQKRDHRNLPEARPRTVPNAIPPASLGTTIAATGSEP